MHHTRIIAMLGLGAGLLGAARGVERNAWPFWVGQTSGSAAAPVETWSAAGPLVFSDALPPASLADDGTSRASGFRPFYVQKTSPDDHVVKAYVLYPFFRYRSWGDGYQWSVFSLINRQVDAADRDGVATTSRERSGFDLWPFYFSRQTASPETTYRAVFPIYGSVPGRFGQSRFTWTLFPLYGRFEKKGVTTTTVPWPFIKIVQGDGNSGFELWPLFGHREKPGSYREQFYLWPFFFKNEAKLSEPQPEVKLGALPFYYRETGPDVKSESYLLFFGHTDRVAPYRYHETRYFWPAFVQGRGDDRYINRWGPFYTHSVVKGVDKTWIAWPFWRQLSYNDGKLEHTKRQFLYFVYNSTQQRSATNASLPVAHKTHVWPLFTSWDNGAGHRQVQALSPMEVFFPGNEAVRLSYNPFFAIYRYDRSGPDRVRTSFLWNFVSYRREPETREFHFGPLYSSRTSNQVKRYSLISGLFGFERRAESGRWRIFAFDFNRRRVTTPTPVVVAVQP